MSNNKQQTAVDSLKDFFKQYDLAHSSLDYYEFKMPMHIFDLKFQEAKEMEKERMIQLVQGLKDYTHESHTILGHDERDASEFVDIFYNKTYGGNK